MANVERAYRKISSFDTVECCFDIVAVFGNDIEQNFVVSTKSKQSEHVQSVSTLSKGRNFVRHCCKKTATVSEQHSTLSKESFDLYCSIRQCCSGIVAGVDGALPRSNRNCCGRL